MDDVDSGTEVDPTDSQPGEYMCVCVHVRTRGEGRVYTSKVMAVGGGGGGGEEKHVACGSPSSSVLGHSIRTFWPCRPSSADKTVSLLMKV